MHDATSINNIVIISTGQRNDVSPKCYPTTISTILGHIKKWIVKKITKVKPNIIDDSIIFEVFSHRSPKFAEY